jgi:hypothetical protein
VIKLAICENETQLAAPIELSQKSLPIVLIIRCFGQPQRLEKSLPPNQCHSSKTPQIELNEYKWNATRRDLHHWVNHIFNSGMIRYLTLPCV